MSAVEPILLGPMTLLFFANLAAGSMLICGLGLLVVRASRGGSEQLRHGLLLAVPVLLLLSPHLFGLAAQQSWRGFHLAVPIGDESARSSSAGIAAEPGAEPTSASDTDAVPIEGFSTTSWRAVGTLLVSLWGVGVIICSLRLATAVRTLARFRRSLTPASDPRVGEALGRAGVGRGVPVLESSLVLTPLSLGLLRPVIVVPRDFSAELSDEQLRLVLMHEAAHIRRHDHWAAAIQWLAAALFWWNPLVHLVGTRLAGLREQICDDFAAGSRSEGRRLAEALLVVAERVAWRLPFPCKALLDGRAELEERVVRLLERGRPRSRRMGAGAWGAVIVFGALTSGALLVSGLRAGEPDVIPMPIQAVTLLSDPQNGTEEVGPSALDVSGEWLLTLPRGFQYRIKLTPLGNNRYRFTPGYLTMTGVYELRGGLMIMVEPTDERLTQFKWELQGGGLKLVESPPRRKIGSDYRGATLRRPAP